MFSMRAAMMARMADAVKRNRRRCSASMVLHSKRCKAPTMESAITIKGQATIPKAIREYLGLRPGDRIKFFLHPNGSVVLLPKLPASALRGLIKPREPPVTIEEIQEAAASGAAEFAMCRKRR